jgi:hypothetical protein
LAPAPELNRSIFANTLVRCPGSQSTIVYPGGSGNRRPGQRQRERRRAADAVVHPGREFLSYRMMPVSLPLVAGTNTIEFANPSAFAPDFDRIIVGNAASAPS